MGGPASQQVIGRYTIYGKIASSAWTDANGAGCGATGSGEVCNAGTCATGALNPPPSEVCERVVEHLLVHAGDHVRSQMLHGVSDVRDGHMLLGIGDGMREEVLRERRNMHERGAQQVLLGLV